MRENDSTLRNSVGINLPGSKPTHPPSLSRRAHAVLRGGRPIRLLESWRNPMSNKRGRDAGNGQFIPVKVAERRSKTAIVETFKTDKNGRPIN